MSGLGPNASENRTVRRNRRVPIATAIAGLVWLSVIVTATVLMFAYAATPGDGGAPPAVWPSASHVVREFSKPTLVMFVHPRCPCSRASIGELAALMAHVQGKAIVRVLFLEPAGTDPGWVETSSWREAAAIPGVVVQRDEDGAEASLFSMKTSGDSVLYAADGRLLFHGGITISRGHSGDNPGREALQALLQNQPAQLAQTPAFGCALFAPGTNAGVTIACRIENSEP
jgi:hypothetical protein